MQVSYTIPGKTYSVHSSAGCTVSDDTGWSKTLSAPEDYFTAHRSKVYIDADDATVRELFKFAPIAMGGGGNSLPAGYTRLAYLMPMGNTSQLKTGFKSWSDLGCRVRGFFDTSRASFFPAQWFVLLGETSTWNPLTYYLTTASLGYRASGSIYYPQTDGAADATGGGNSKRGYSIAGDFLVNYNWLGNMQWKYNDADNELERSLSAVGGALYDDSIVIFGRGGQIENWSGGIREVSFSRGGKIIGHMVPVLNEQGQATMWDMIRKVPLEKNKDGDFIAGIDTQAQFNNMLRKLPDRSGLEVGTLQVRLAETLQTEANLEALNDMAAKNWEISQAV